MAQKRAWVPYEETENPESQDTTSHHRNQRFKPTVLLPTCLPTRCLFKDGLPQEYTAMVENAIRKPVREEAEQAVLKRSNLWSSPNEGGPSKSRKLKLEFMDQLPKTIFTGNNISAKGSSSPLKIELLDSVSGEVVRLGPLSSAKVKIVVLQGDFKVEKLEDWTQKEFSDNIVRPRTNKPPLLVGGECIIALQNGVGFVKGLSFSDNSSWVSCKMFRLGAQTDSKMAQQGQVREAVTTPFKVLHHRGQVYEKHSDPSLEHEVWHLKGISRDGIIHNKLKDNQIHTVKDLVQQYQKDQSSLRNLLGPKPFKDLSQQLTKFCTCPINPVSSQVQPYACSIESSHSGQILDMGIHGNGLTMEELLLLKSCNNDRELQNWPIGCNFLQPSPLDSVDTDGLLSMINLNATGTLPRVKHKRCFWSKIRAVWRMVSIKK